MRLNYPVTFVRENDKMIDVIDRNVGITDTVVFLIDKLFHFLSFFCSSVQLCRKYLLVTNKRIFSLSKSGRKGLPRAKRGAKISSNELAL